MSVQEEEADVSVEINNIGGIKNQTLHLDRGTNLLAGPNSTNKTSTLQALALGLGLTEPKLKSDATEGEVSLVIDGEEYTRHLQRKNGSVHIEGNPYLDDSEAAENFAFLLESNKARLSVEQNRDLREIIMEAVDTEEIELRIKQLTSQRESIQREIREVEEKEKSLDELRRRREDIQNELDEKKKKLSEVEREIRKAEDDVSDIKNRRSRLNELIEKRSSLENEIEELESRLNSERQCIDSLEDELADKREELEGLPEDYKEKKSYRMEEIEDDIERLQARQEELDKILSELQEVIDFNSRMLDDREAPHLFGAEEHDDSSKKTDVLVEEKITCWTCGNEVNPDAVSETLNEIKELRQRKNSQIGEIKDDIEDLRTKKQEIEKELNRLKDLETEVDRIEEELGRRRSKTEDLQEEIEDKKDALSEVEQDIQDIESELDETDTDSLDAHRRKKELEVEIASLKDEIDEVEESIEDIEAKIERKHELKNELGDVEDSLRRERNRIDRLEEDAVESFNSHMDELLDILEYENLERIWIEPRDTQQKEGRRKIEKRVFDLNVVREDEDGNVYQDSIENLSESEKEVVGLVFALAGYLAHEVYEDLPFMLIDSLGALDVERVENLLNYFEGHFSYLVAAVLPEVADNVGDQYNIVGTRT